MNRGIQVLGGAARLAVLLSTATSVSAQTLGLAQSYAVLGGTAVTAAGTGTVITGDVGVSPGTAINGFPAGAVIVGPFATHANDASAIAAQTSVTSLYNTLAATAGGTALVPELGGRTLTPGTYTFGATANIAAGTTLTLSGGGTYIFKVGSSLTANVGSSIILLNGASACNVFFQVTGAATLNGVSFSGTVVAQTAVTLGAAASLNGRALTTAAGSVTLAGGNTVGGCSAAGGGCPTISIAPATVPNGTVAVAYNQTLTGSGGAIPYTFVVTSGALPAGLTLTAAGVLAGTPTTAGSSTFTIRGTDANGCSATITYTIVIAAAPVCPTITLAPTTFPDGTVAVAFNQTITATGGSGATTFAVTSGTLPGGLTLTPAGALTGTPTTAGTFTFTIRGTDATGCGVTAAFTVVIAAAPVPPPVCPAITILPASLPNGTVGVPFTQTLTGSGGPAPFTFGVTAGTLSPGLTLTPAGVLAGTPTAAGTSTATIRGTAANGCFAELIVTSIIAVPVPTLPQVFFLLLASGLAALGYARLRRRA